MTAYCNSVDIFMYYNQYWIYIIVCTLIFFVICGIFWCFCLRGKMKESDMLKNYATKESEMQLK